jgi:hypothetical protein
MNGTKGKQIFPICITLRKTRFSRKKIYLTPTQGIMLIVSRFSFFNIVVFKIARGMIVETSEVLIL